MLFLLYINDFPSVCNLTFRLFADVCILYHGINSTTDHETRNEALNSVHNWCQEWQMMINIKKSAVLSISLKKVKTVFNYAINNITIPKVNEHKYLGLTLSHDLRCETHINKITSSALKRLFLRHRLRLAPSNTELLTYITPIQPILEYGIVAWFPHTKKLISQLEGVQRKAICFVFNKCKLTDSPTELLTKARLLTIENREKIARLKFLFQCLN